MAKEAQVSSGEAMQEVFEDLTRPNSPITAKTAAQKIDNIVHNAIDAQVLEAKNDPDRSQHAGNPDGIIWELWDQLCIQAMLSNNSPILVDFLRALETLPKRRVLQRTDWSVDSQSSQSREIELWTDVANLGGRPLAEWLWEFDECTFLLPPPTLRLPTDLTPFTLAHFCNMAELESPPPGSAIREHCRNYNAFTARLMSSGICFMTSREGAAALRNTTLALENALEPDRQAVQVRPKMMEPECRSGHIPAAVEWMRHAAKPTWTAVQEGYFVKKKYNRKGVEKPEWSILGAQRWKAWKQEFCNIADDERYTEEIRSLSREAFGFMNTADGTSGDTTLGGKSTK